MKRINPNSPEEMKHVGRGGIAEMPQQDSHKQHERDSQRNAKNFILPRYIPTKITNEYNSIVLASETLPGLEQINEPVH